MRSAVKRLEIWQAIERYATNPTRAVSRDLLSRETGVPERTLDHICHAFTGLSPIAYIKRRHMSLAHAMLQRAAPDATVTSIATFCGFSDLGRFAVRYHHRYGQPPSQTLRQPAQPIVAPLARTGAILHVPEGAPSPDGNIQEPPLPLYWLSVEDLICRNRALLAEAAAARALQRQVAAVAASFRREGQRVRRRAVAMRRELDVLRLVAPPLNVRARQ
ncbi:MAG TPA: helix-turn-helix domain-containing protein [Acetobacteraceae bacterium]|nr:helix-turn-helix domain-containing protein [Acetobacteraceae bacterium]